MQMDKFCRKTSKESSQVEKEKRDSQSPSQFLRSWVVRWQNKGCEETQRRIIKWTRSRWQTEEFRETILRHKESTQVTILSSFSALLHQFIQGRLRGKSYLEDGRWFDSLCEVISEELRVSNIVLVERITCQYSTVWMNELYFLLKWLMEWMNET